MYIGKGVGLVEVVCELVFSGVFVGDWILIVLVCILGFLRGKDVKLGDGEGAEVVVLVIGDIGIGFESIVGVEDFVLVLEGVLILDREVEVEVEILEFLVIFVILDVFFVCFRVSCKK